MNLTGEKGDSMGKFKKVHDQIRAITSKTTDEVIYKILVLITGNNELLKISGIEKSPFFNQAKEYYLANGNRFSDKYRAGVIRTLNVYADNIVSARKLND